MVIAYWFGVAATAVAIAVANFRRVGLKSVSAWFIVLSIVLVNTGFLLGHLQYGGDGTHWSADGIVATSTGLLAFAMGSLVKNKKVDARKPAQNVTHGSQLQLVVLTLAILGPAWLYFYLLGSVPLFDGISAVLRTGLDGLGQLQASRLARDPYASQHGQRIPLQGLLQIFRTIGAPMLVAYAYIELRNGAKRRPRIVVIILAVVTCLAAGQRWPLIYLGVALAIAIGVSERRPPYRRILTLGSAVLGLGVVVSALQARTLDGLNSVVEALSFAVSDLMERIFLDQVYVPVLSYGPTGEQFTNLAGNSYFQSLLAYVPGPGASFSVDFYRGVTGDTTGYTATPDFYTEAYINFGLIGVVLMSALWGITLGNFSNFVSSSDNSGRRATWTIMGAVAALSCYSGVVFTAGVMFVVAAAWIALLLASANPGRPRIAGQVERDAHA